MAIKDPQRDLPPGFRGGADAWDNPAGAIVALDYFPAAAVAGVYYVIGLAAGWVDPTPAEIVAGTLSGGAGAAASGSQPTPVSSGTLDYPAATGLAAGQAYKVAFVWWSGVGSPDPFAGNVSNVSVGSFSTSAGTFPALCLVSGQLQQNPAATAGDVKVYLTSAGALVAKTTAGGGDRLVNLVAGEFVAA